MTDQEIETALSACFDAVDARQSLKRALASFCQNGEVARQMFERARAERPDVVRPEDAGMISMVLEGELTIGKQLQELMEQNEQNDVTPKVAW